MTCNHKLQGALKMEVDWCHQSMWSNTLYYKLETSWFIHIIWNQSIVAWNKNNYVLLCVKDAKLSNAIIGITI
jgi:hypothetical protein